MRWRSASTSSSPGRGSRCSEAIVDRPIPQSLKDLQAEHAAQTHDLQAMSLGYERLRRAARAVFESVGGDSHAIARALLELGEAYLTTNPTDEPHLLWAADVLDGRIVRRRMTERPQKETFEEVKRRAREFNLYVHYTHTFEGSAYAIYRGTTKIADAANEGLCIARLRTLMRAR